ncbi:hypothetical protein Cal7507_5823 [Calothrix sp. PCC 7507]|nr:hypothetical protein Cal7507_5823 [Calothrix sp. PCC 7507]
MTNSQLSGHAKNKPLLSLKDLHFIPMTFIFLKDLNILNSFKLVGCNTANNRR